jgi:hypothetical protein
MGLHLSDPTELYTQLEEHVGHQLEVVSYANGVNIAIECIDCGCVLVDANHPSYEEVE